MVCARCGAQVASNRRFCGDCGTPMPWQCSTCGSDNPAEKKFCGDCGTSRGSTSNASSPVAAPAPSPERRPLSVMFIDLVGSTAIGQRLDPEDFREVITAFHNAVKALVVHFEGFIARYMGDGILAYFGYPKAHETDVERAVRSALTIVEAVASLNTLAGPPGTLSVRIGIDTGLVVAGDLIGFGASLEAAVVGDTPNLAARLQGAAQPGTVVISDATRVLVGGLFDCQELLLSELKGRRNVTHAWVVLGESQIDSRYEALRRGQSSLVGRTEELEFMLRRWDRAKSGDGRVILLVGDPGIGKSRMIAALEESIGSSPHLCLKFFCSPHHLDTPLHPIIRHIESAAGFQRGDSPAAKWDKLTSILPRGASSEDKALLADLVSICSPIQNSLSALKPQQRKAKTFAAIIRQIDALAHARPTLTVIEDIHWADPSTLELLHLLIETVQERPMLIVVTARPHVRPAWAFRPQVTVQLLSGLDRPTAEALIRHISAKRELSPEIIDRIIAHSDNVPLFIEELTKTVISKLEDRNLGINTSSLEPLAIDAVPTSLHSSLIARLDRLVAGKEIAQIGAVIGREFSFDLVQTLSALPAKQLKNTLAELARAEIIVMRGELPFATYLFRHALVQEAAYASLLRDRRRSIHLRIAEEMEKDASGDVTEPHLIARHFAEAGVPDRAIQYFQKAAERATGRFTLGEMVNHLRNALRQIAFLPKSPECYRRELALLLTLGQALIDFEGGHSEPVRETFERARELCFELDEINLLPRVYDGLLVNYYFIRSNPGKIIEYTKEMIESHRRTGDPRALLLIRRASCLANFLLGDFAQARDDMQSLVDMYDADRDGPGAEMTTRDPKAAMNTFLGVCLSILGYVDSGAAKIREGIYHAKTLNHPVSLNLGLRRACVQNMLCRDVRQVAEFSRQLAELRATYETYQGNWEGTFFQDWAQLWMKPDPVRSDRVHRFLRHLDSTNIWALLPFYMASAAELSGRHGDIATATALLDRAEELVDATGGRWCQAEIMRLRARFAAQSPDATVVLLRSSLAKAREQGAKLWELRTATDLAKILLGQENHVEARQVLRPIYEWFSEGKDRPDNVAARELLCEIERLPSAIKLD